MKFQELKRRLRVEAAYLHPLTLAVSAGVCVFFGIFFWSGLPLHFRFHSVPSTPIPSFLHILLQLMAYALFGAAFAVLLDVPFCLGRRLESQKTAGLILFLCILVLCYVWIPLVCRAGSYFLGAMLCLVILLALFALVLLIHRISILSTGLLCFFSLWMLYLLYLTLKLLFF